MSLSNLIQRTDAREHARHMRMLRERVAYPEPRMVDLLVRGDVVAEIDREMERRYGPNAAYVRRMEAALPDGPVERMAETDGEGSK